MLNSQADFDKSAKYSTSATFTVCNGVTMIVLGTQAVLLQCLDALCQYSEQVVAHHKAVTAHLLPALAAAVGRPSESRDSRFLCLKLLCDVILHFLLETDLYIAPQQSQPTGPGWFLSSV